MNNYLFFPNEALPPAAAVGFLPLPAAECDLSSAFLLPPAAAADDAGLGSFGTAVKKLYDII